MKISIIYNVFLRDFRKQKKRIALTLTALMWGTISIMLLLGFGEGLHQQMSLQKKGMGDGIVVMWGGQTAIPYKGLGKGRRIRFVDDDITFLQESIPELKNVGGEFDRWGVRTERGDRVFSEHVVGVTPNYEEMRNYIPQWGGRMINDADMKLRRRVVFLGWEVKKRLFDKEDPIGKTVLFNSLPFTVVGVMKEKMQMGNYSGMDEDKCVIPLYTFQTMFGDPWLDNMVYQLDDKSTNKKVEKRLFEIFGAKYKFDPTDDRAISLWDTVESSAEFDKILMGIKIFLGIIGGLTLLIAGVGVANIMYVSIKERTREIGIKIAVGARKSYILAQFLIEAMIITFLGGFGGMAISYVMTEGFKRIPIESDVLDMMGRPTISFEIGLIVVCILSVMSIVSGLFPAMKAASLNPVDSLRYE